MAAESGESDGGDADAGKDGSSTKHHKNKDPLASPVAKLFRKHSHACRHTSAKVHRVFGQPVLHPRFEGDVDTVELATRHLTKECQCVGPPSNLERRAVATLSGMSTTEVDERVPRIICPECQHDLAFHREGTDAEKHNTRILAHFRPTLLAQCTTDAQPILPPSRSLESLALLLNGTASIYPGKKSKPSKASSWLPRIFGKRSKGKAGDDAPVCIHVDDDDDGGKNDGDHGDGSNSTITTTANGGGNQSRGEHNKQAKQAESSAEKRGAQQRKRASKDVEAVDATDSSGEGESAVLETPKKRPKHSFLGLKEFFIPAPKSKPTPPPTPPHPFQGIGQELLCIEATSDQGFHPHT
ncbi:hypothetical protein PTSG_00526 [Salpingoeca rosetta]|uniref:Uncharacterized protein n=1 Tax=Salpingoeca rosetta (strain ATCC 50818 / BSB-021) TaxID=946362 RepID=F2TWQ4_SALR5|nr:uncharacterized protein PTSG_00526 [Salpingoeca rosetta]EGD72500.1 hypothetical protein PTSG_00526 [Salpingoeca rosetta]|eukprot:XP_004999069.1 hypothetical protein PTSG_00526 [Salpingoeca rosetta]